MRLVDKIIPTTELLAGFNMASEMTPGEIKFPIYTKGMTQDTTLDVMTIDMSYNIILGMP